MIRTPKLFFSFRSPFSWLLVHRLLESVPDAHQRLVWFPYWEPDAITTSELDKRGASVHYTAMSRAKHRYILMDTKRLARRFGVEMKWPVDLNAWWEPSHLGWLQARRVGRAAEFYDAVVAARWQRAEDICDLEVLRTICESIGLDGDKIVASVDDPELRAEGVDCLAEAYEEDIFGVPYLRLGLDRFWGVDRLDEFLAAYLPTLGLVEQANSVVDPPRRQREPVAAHAGAPSRSGSAYDTDTAGGCG